MAGTRQPAGPAVDLNADLGEGFGIWTLGDDDALLSVITSANVACGFHAGDPAIMERVCARAAAAGVRIGAQVGYRDLAGFGRRDLDVAPGELRADVLYQLGALEAFARAAGSRVSYLKPHGALYHRVSRDEAQAAAVVAAAARFAPGLPVLGAPGSVFLRLAAAAGLAAVPEAFADRGYQPDGRLVSRRESGAVISDPAEVGRRAVRLARDGRVDAVDGTAVAVAARSLCVHGDTPGAAALAAAVRAALTSAGVRVAAFT